MWIQTKGVGLQAGRSDAVDSKKWRFLREITSLSGLDILYIVDFPHRWFVVRGMTIDDFLTEYEYLGIKEVEQVTFVKDSLPCPKCLGWGRFDWLQVARGSDTMRHPRHNEGGDFQVEKSVYHYKQQGRIPSHDGKSYKYLTSKPKLDETDKLCEECFGSGLSLRQEEGNAWFWNTLGHWYKKTEDQFK